MSVTRLQYPKIEPDIHCLLNFYEYKRVRPAQSDPDIKLVQTIRLPIPTSLPDSYNANINSQNLDILGNSVRDLLSAGKTSLEEVSLAGSTTSDILKQVVETGIRAAAVAPLVPDGLARLAQVSAGVVRNPHTTAMFEGVNLREFNLQWVASPRSQEEARSLSSIFNSIKAFMHPNIAMGGFALEYPHLVTVVLRGVNLVGNVDPKNNYVTYVRHAFIRNFQLNYSGAGAPAFYWDGTPVSYDFSLDLQEVNILTRNELTGQGYKYNNFDPYSMAGLRGQGDT